MYKIYSIPNLGFGTYRLKGDVAYNSTLIALQQGYRHIDTANLYKNEVEIGKAIKASSISRNEIWITTKIQVNDIKKGIDIMYKSIVNSLQQLDTEYLDLVLLHGPVDNEIVNNWKALEEIFLYKLNGKIRFIGISNYNMNHIELLLSDCKVKPYTNQIEISPYYFRRKLINYCQEKGIIVTAHTSLVKGEKFNDSKLENLSQKKKISKSILLLSWALSKNMIVLPRSSKEEHIIENMKSVDTILDIETIDELNGFHDGYCTHPHYKDNSN